jgi:YfiH family protein
MTDKFRVLERSFPLSPALMSSNLCPQAVETATGFLFASALLDRYADRLRYGFTGKPLTVGGPAFPLEERRANRRHWCQVLGLEADRLVVPTQVHGCRISRQDDPDTSQSDGILLTEPGQPAMVVTADCVPVLLYEPEAHVAAAVHAGWRGTAQRIVANAVERLLATNPEARAERLVVAIGPAIGPCCFEVGPEVIEQLSATAPNVATQSSGWASACLQKADKFYADVRTVNRLQLEALGVTMVEVSPVCTRCETERLFSYRRGDSGRQGAFLQLL